jgi:DNA-binding FadR family transcriptional regulator
MNSCGGWKCGGRRRLWPWRWPVNAATSEQLAGIQSLTGELEDIHELDDCVRAVRATHVMLCEAAHNEYLADAMTPLQGLSRRFWLAHVVDAADEIGSGKSLHRQLLRSILARDAEAAQQASIQLNDYLVRFALGAATRNARLGRLGAPQY